MGPFLQLASEPQWALGFVLDAGQKSDQKAGNGWQGGAGLTDSSPAWVSDPEGGVGLSCALHSVLPTAVMLPGRKPPRGNAPVPSA